MSEINYGVLNNNTNNTDNANKYKNKSCYMTLYSITHIIIAFFALFLSWKCNLRNGSLNFNLLHFLAALLFPQFYIIWAVAMKGGCGTM